ncbi:MAG TPA: class I SAM-dependent methyltransferase [Acidimicrobiales bacterium]|nr:class I SAM-dependent methyltransferase [Acidimicrobiales bacterium]
MTGRLYRALTVLSMAVGRGPAARAAVESAVLSRDDRVVDIGCGPGAAVRLAAAGCAHATGVDPDPAMLRMARAISGARRSRNVSWLEGSAAAVPGPDASATVVWAVSSAHHWPERAAGWAEARRLLASGGRLLVVERLTRPGATGHGSHGLTQSQADRLAEELAEAGFAGVQCEVIKARRRKIVVLKCVSPRSGG